MAKIVTIFSTMDARVLKERLSRGVKTDNIDLCIGQCVARLGGYDGYVALDNAVARGNHKIVGFSMGSGWFSDKGVAVVHWAEGDFHGETEIPLTQLADEGVVSKYVRGVIFDVQRGRIEGEATVEVEDWEANEAMQELATMCDVLIAKGDGIRQKRAEREARLAAQREEA